MLVDFENCESTGESSIYWLLSETVVYASAAGRQPMFTIYTAGGGRPGTGESITTTFDVFVEDVTHLVSERIEDDYKRLDNST